jgi:hypothetical protein
MASSFLTLLPKFEAGAFASPFRSTVPLIAFAKDNWSGFKKLLSTCGLSEDVEVHFEFKVKSPKGNGKPSHTDAMVLSATHACAVEAKWTEPRYDTVEKRLKRKDPKDPEGVNAREFVEGWLERLQPFAMKPLRLNDFSMAVYQMVHRAASASAMSRSPSLIYLHFEFEGGSGGASTDQYHTDLTYLHNLLGQPLNFPFHLVEVGIKPTSAFSALEHLKKGSPETDLTVRSALLSGMLFEFGETHIQTIGGQP